MTTLLIAAGLLTDGQGRVLLVRKAGTTAFMQPGGKIEPGEVPEAALVREVSEELGLTIAVERVREVGYFLEKAANEADTWLEAHAFAVTLSPAEVETASPTAEIAEARWVTLDEARELELAPLTANHLLPLLRAELALVEAVGRLVAADVEPEILGRLTPAHRKFLVPQRARIAAVGYAWRLGNLLLTREANLAVSERVIRSQSERQHGYPSADARERAELGTLAERDGIAAGRLVHLGWRWVSLTEDPLVSLIDGRVQIRWSDQAPPVVLVDFVAERVELLIDGKSAGS